MIPDLPSWLERVALVFALLCVCAVVATLRHAGMLPGVLHP